MTVLTGHSGNELRSLSNAESISRQAVAHLLKDLTDFIA